MKLNASNIPEEMQRRPQWVGFMLLENIEKGKPDKVPIDPHTLWGARAGRPETWGEFGAAQALIGKRGRCKRGGKTASAPIAGVGWEFNGDGIVGVDFDHCMKDGRLDPWAARWVERFNSYTEISPSGDGLHIFCKGALPGKAIKRPEAELYDRGRYFTVTGNVYGPMRRLKPAQAAIDALYEELQAASLARRAEGPASWEMGPVLAAGPKSDRPPLRDPPQVGRDACGKMICPDSFRQNLSNRKRPPHDGTPGGEHDDTILLEKIRRSRNGAAFAALWGGDTSAYGGDESRADMALCDMLAFWTNGDAGRMDRLFRVSGLMRPKWDRPTGGSTYGAITIGEAIRTARSGYDPQAHFQREAHGITFSGRGLQELRPEQNRRYGWNDIGNGYLFADWFKEIARYVPERRKWYVYDGAVWRPDTGGLKAMELCKRLADDLVIYSLSLPEGEKYREFVRKWQRRANRETVLKDASSVYPVPFAAFDADPYLFNCQNGTLDLRTFEFRPHRPGDLLSQMAGVRYDPAARCERWEQFIDEVMCGDRDKALYLQKALGLALTGDTSHECFFILYGPKSRNGKGTAMETFTRLMGDYGKAAKAATIAQRQNANGSGPSEDIARLSAARFVNIPEPDKNLVLSAALVKTLTGNDTITARFLNENSIEFRPQFKLFINTNHLPAVTDVTLFSSGRVKVLPFERHFEEGARDTGLKRRFARPESLSGILNWCLEGLRLLEGEGFETPASVLEATDAYRQDSDKTSRFLAEELEAGFGYEVPTALAYARYQEWCYRNGYRESNSKTFKADMENVVEIVRKRPKSGGSPTTIIVGYRLIPTADIQATFTNP